MLTAARENGVFVIRAHRGGRKSAAVFCLLISAVPGIMVFATSGPAKLVSISLLTVTLVVGISLLISVRTMTTSIDSNLKKVSITIKRLLKVEGRSYQFQELAKSFGGLRVNTKYVLYRGSWDRTYSVYGIAMVLATGEEIDLTD